MSALRTQPSDTDAAIEEYHDLCSHVPRNVTDAVRQLENLVSVQHALIERLLAERQARAAQANSSRGRSEASSPFDFIWSPFSRSAQASPPPRRFRVACKVSPREGFSASNADHLSAVAKEQLSAQPGATIANETEWQSADARLVIICFANGARSPLLHELESWLDELRVANSTVLLLTNNSNNLQSTTTIAMLNGYHAAASKRGAKFVESSIELVTTTTSNLYEFTDKVSTISAVWNSFRL